MRTATIWGRGKTVSVGVGSSLRDEVKTVKASKRTAKAIVLQIVMSSVKQKNGPSLNFPKTESVGVGQASAVDAKNTLLTFPNV